MQIDKAKWDIYCFLATITHTRVQMKIYSIINKYLHFHYLQKTLTPNPRRLHQSPTYDIQTLSRTLESKT